MKGLQEAVPNLGLLICLLAVSPRHKWGQVAVPLLVEVLDRQVLWVCKAKPSLAASYARPEVTGGESPLCNCSSTRTRSPFALGPCSVGGSDSQIWALRTKPNST